MRIKHRITTWITLAAIFATSAAAAQEKGEGVKVHGRWTLEVLNADGSVASRHDFNNALVIGTPTLPGGTTLLAGLLGRYYRVDSWQVSLHGASAGLCHPTSLECGLSEYVGPGEPGINQVKAYVPLYSLAKVHPQGTFELRGLSRIVGAGSITAVSATLRACSNGCPDANGEHAPEQLVFTRHDLATPLAVTANQVIQVRVVFSVS